QRREPDLGEQLQGLRDAVYDGGHDAGGGGDEQRLLRGVARSGNYWIAGGVYIHHPPAGGDLRDHRLQPGGQDRVGGWRPGNGDRGDYLRGDWVWVGASVLFSRHFLGRRTSTNGHE